MMHAVRHSILQGGSLHAEEECEEDEDALNEESTKDNASKNMNVQEYPIIKPFIVCSKLLGA